VHKPHFVRIEPLLTISSLDVIAMIDVTETGTETAPGVARGRQTTARAAAATSTTPTLRAGAIETESAKTATRVGTVAEGRENGTATEVLPDATRDGTTTRGRGGIATSVIDRAGATATATKKERWNVGAAQRRRRRSESPLRI
jgi:hypothetical protein